MTVTVVAEQVVHSREKKTEAILRKQKIIVCRPVINIYVVCMFQYVRGASKIKLKKVNKKRTVTVRRVIIFLNISRLPLLICLQCCLHQYKTLKAVASATAAIVLLTPAKNLKKVFFGVSSGLTLV
jgi:hypothetical protein